MVLACHCSRSARAQDVWYYDLVRQEFFAQATTNRPATGAAVTHDLFGALAALPGSSLGSVTLSSPGGARGWSLDLNFNGTRFLTSSQPDETYHLSRPAASGAYQFQVLRTSGSIENFKATLPGPANAYAPPRVANFLEAQTVDASQPFTVRWDKVNGTRVHDFVGVQIFATNGDSVFSSSLQNGSETNLTIEAGRLQPGSNYNAEVFLIHYFAYVTTRSPLQFIREER